MIRTDAPHRPSRAVVRRELRAVAAALVTALLVAGAAGAGARAAAAAEPVLDPAYGVNGRAAAGFTDVLGVDAATDGAGRRVVLGQ
ncbi:MAG TPA: hypothetical protein VES42_04445, partial [Pilimelia sp.]|nr:hypothetical protein [Pilimelia sp.]